MERLVATTQGRGPEDSVEAWNGRAGKGGNDGEETRLGLLSEHGWSTRVGLKWPWCQTVALLINP